MSILTRSNNKQCSSFFASNCSSLSSVLRLPMQICIVLAVRYKGLATVTAFYLSFNALPWRIIRIRTSSMVDLTFAGFQVRPGQLGRARSLGQRAARAARCSHQQCSLGQCHSGAVRTRSPQARSGHAAGQQLHPALCCNYCQHTSWHTSNPPGSKCITVWCDEPFSSMKCKRKHCCTEYARSKMHACTHATAASSFAEPA